MRSPRSPGLVLNPMVSVIVRHTQRTDTQRRGHGDVAWSPLSPRSWKRGTTLLWSLRGSPVLPTPPSRALASGGGGNEFLSLPSFAPAAPGPSRRLNIRQLLGRLVRARVVLLLLIAPGYHFRKRSLLKEVNGYKYRRQG